MKLKKPKFWDYKKPHLYSYLLLPCSIILRLISKIRSKPNLTNLVNKLIIKPNNKKNYLKIEKIGKKILNETKDEINNLLNNEIKKT